MEQLAQDQTLKRDGPSLYIAVFVAIAVATLMVTTTFTIFLNSSAYSTVKRIQANQNLAGQDLQDYDTISPVKAVDIDETIKGVQNTMGKLNPENDYGPAPTSKESLGLPL